MSEPRLGSKAAPSPRVKPRLGLRFWIAVKWPFVRARAQARARGAVPWALEVAGIAAIGGFAYTIYEGAALLVAGLYLLGLAYRGDRRRRR